MPSLLSLMLWVREQHWLVLWTVVSASASASASARWRDGGVCGMVGCVGCSFFLFSFFLSSV